VGRELTKLHEEFRAGTAADVLAYYEAVPPRGELTVLLEGRRSKPDVISSVDASARAAELLAEGLSRKAAVQRLVKETMIPRNEAYRIVMAVP
jgi:16S rRNA (cytidine1402-2'-O)-methyltransferase